MRVAQIEVIIFKITPNQEPLFLMLKRNEEKGGFWQPVTGGVETGEEVNDAVKRELKEELGLGEVKKIIPDVYYFEFDTKTYGRLKEYVFGVEISNEQELTLSSEHTESKWCTLNEALELLEYENNKEGLRRLSDILKKK